MISLLTFAVVASLTVGMQTLWAKKPAEKLPKDKPPAVTIFVGPQRRDGFIDVDRGVLDSISDIKDD